MLLPHVLHGMLCCCVVCSLVRIDPNVDEAATLKTKVKLTQTLSEDPIIARIKQSKRLPYPSQIPTLHFFFFCVSVPTTLLTPHALSSRSFLSIPSPLTPHPLLSTISFSLLTPLLQHFSLFSPHLRLTNN